MGIATPNSAQQEYELGGEAKNDVAQQTHLQSEALDAGALFVLKSKGNNNEFIIYTIMLNIENVKK